MKSNSQSKVLKEISSLQSSRDNQLARRNKKGKNRIKSFKCSNLAVTCLSANLTPLRQTLTKQISTLANWKETKIRTKMLEMYPSLIQGDRGTNLVGAIQLVWTQMPSRKRVQCLRSARIRWRPRTLHPCQPGMIKISHLVEIQHRCKVTIEMLMLGASSSNQLSKKMMEFASHQERLRSKGRV